MFENLSLGHLLVVLVIVLLLFGAKRIPEIAGSMGKGINEFKKTMSGTGAGTDEAAPPSQVASRDSKPISSGTPSTSTAMAKDDDVVREPKRLF